MENIEFLGSMIYVYCTDFVINLGNLFNLSYYEINAIIFCVIWPLFTLTLILLNIYKLIVFKKIRHN